jgi:hypothetical protein
MKKKTGYRKNGTKKNKEVKLTNTKINYLEICSKINKVAIHFPLHFCPISFELVSKLSFSRIISYP